MDLFLRIASYSSPDLWPANILIVHFNSGTFSAFLPKYWFQSFSLDQRFYTSSFGPNHGDPFWRPCTQGKGKYCHAGYGDEYGLDVPSWVPTVCPVWLCFSKQLTSHGWVGLGHVGMPWRTRMKFKCWTLRSRSCWSASYARMWWALDQSLRSDPRITHSPAQITDHVSQTYGHYHQLLTIRCSLLTSRRIWSQTVLLILFWYSLSYSTLLTGI